MRERYHGDQATAYTYGTTLAESEVARNDLLRSVAYPDSAGSSDTVRYGYNRLGQQRTITDQRGTVRTLYYDKLGRLTNDCVTTNGSGTDVAVKQIATAYEVRGMVNQVTSTDNAAQGGGTVLNQARLDYNAFGQLVTEWQAHGGSVGGSSPKVEYGYASGASNSNQVRPTTLTYPDGRVITGGYGTAGGMNDWLNRIADLSDPSATLAAYTYLGLWTVVRINYPEPAVRLDLWGGTSGVFDGFDRFSRITDQGWQNDVTGTPTDIDRYQYGYDRNSNRTWKRNTVGSALDEFYTYDRLNRLNQMQRGTLTGTPPTGIAGTPAKEQDWTLDPVGNWSAFINKTAGTTDLNQTRTHSTVNEITAIGGTPAWATPPAYDAAGNMTSFPQPTSPGSAFGAVYDAWNRLTKVTDGANTVAEYVYDGLGRRIVKKTYTGGTLTETRHIYWNIGWQAIEERVGTSTTADRQQVWGGRYVDELVCRDDPTHGRLYALQDANFNLTAIVDAVGVVVERSNYTPYGVISYLAPNWTSRAVSSYGWVVGFQGLLYDPETGNWYQRARYSNPLLGRFMQREPMGAAYQDGMNLYLFEQGNPIINRDLYGRQTIATQPTKPIPFADEPKSGRPFAVENGIFSGKLSYPGTKAAPWWSSKDTVDDWDGVTFELTFVPKKGCSCTEIKYEQWIREWRSGRFWGLNSTNGFVIDDGTNSDTNKTPAWYPHQTPWNKGSNIGATMTDTPGYTGDYIYQEFIVHAICVGGDDAGKVYGTYRWGWEKNGYTGRVQIFTNGQYPANGNMPYGSGSGTINDSRFIPND